MSKPNGNGKASVQRRRKSRSAHRSSNNYPSVTFENGAESHVIPYEEDRSPVATHQSNCSSPGGVKYMDEIALLKRGLIDKDASKHPYNRRGQQFEKELSMPSSSASASISFSKESLASLLGEPLFDERVIKVGKDGTLKHSKTKSGGDRYELSVTGSNKFALFQQGNGQSCLCTYSK